MHKKKAVLEVQNLNGINFTVYLIQKKIWKAYLSMAADNVLKEVAPKRRQEVTYTCIWHNRLTIYITPTYDLNI